MSEKMRQVIKNIEVLRGVSALLVVLVHGTKGFQIASGIPPFHGIFNFGAYGVDVFFVISGFIIYHVNSQTASASDIRGYLSRRFIRIYPMYWVATAFLSIMLLASHTDASGRNVHTLKIFSDLCLIPSAESIYPAGTYLTVAWTLIYEVSFYAFFLVRFLSQGVFFAIAIAWSMFIVVEGFSFEPRPWQFDFLSSQVFLEFFLGIIAAALYEYSVIKSRAIALSLFVLGVVAFLAAGVCESLWNIQWKTFSLGTLMYGIPGFCMVLGGASLEGLKLSFGNRMFLTLGAATYSIYLFHSTLMSIAWRLCRSLAGHVGIPVNAFYLPSCVLIVAMCVVVHRRLERPILERCKQWFASHGLL